MKGISRLMRLVCLEFIVRFSLMVFRDTSVRVFHDVLMKVFRLVGTRRPPKKHTHTPERFTATGGSWLSWFW